MCIRKLVVNSKLFVMLNLFISILLHTLMDKRPKLKYLILNIVEYILVKRFFYYELGKGNRKRGGQLFMYKDVQKSPKRRCNIELPQWKHLAALRPEMWGIGEKQVREFEEQRKAHLDYKRDMVKARSLVVINYNYVPSMFTKIHR